MRTRLTTVVAALALAGAASAQSWNEQGDAGDLPNTAQVPQGQGPLTQIRGAVPSIFDTDMYLIEICDVPNFRAFTNESWDTQLWLFDLNGFGITFNDDALPNLQAEITGRYVPQPGQYLLAINGYNRDAADSRGQLIWENMQFAPERQPDGPGRNNPLSQWVGESFYPNETYTIFLRGACFVPTPASAGVLALGALAAARRRR